MSKRIIACFVLLGIALLAMSLYLSFAYDAVTLEPKPVTGLHPDGTVWKYDYLAPSPQFKWAKLMSELFTTAAIAIFIYFAIEYSLGELDKKQQKREHDKIIRDVFDGVLQRLMPSAIFKAISNDVINQPIIIEEARWNYAIEEIRTADTLISYRVIQRVYHTFYNTATAKKSIPVRVLLYKSAISNQWVNYFEIKDPTTNKIRVKETKAEIEANGTKVSENLFIREVNEEIEGGQRLNIYQEIYNEYPTVYVQDFHFTNYSMIKLTLIVTKPKKCKFTKINTFSENLELERDNDELLEYKPIMGVLKGQSLIYQIEPQS